MNKAVVIALCALLCTFTQHTQSVSLVNDLALLAQADPKYAGFDQAPVYVDNTHVHDGHTINVPKISGQHVTIEIEIPASFALALTGKTIPSFWSHLLGFVRCYLNMKFQVEYTDATYYLTDILVQNSVAVEKKEMSVSIELRGPRSITAYFHK